MIHQIRINMFNSAYLNAFDSTHKHPRLNLRLVAIASAAIGTVLSICTLVSALHERFGMGRARIVSGVALIPLTISILWHLFDLTHSRVANGRRSPPANLAVMIEGAGFSAFLALLISNGFVIKDLAPGNYGMGIMLTYNQFPWIVCSGIHAILVIQQLHLLGGPRLCERCRQEMGQSARTKGKVADDYAPLVAHQDSYEDDVETHVVTAGPMSTHDDGP